MIRITDKSKCSGCYSCENACPQNCITMVSDNEGFWYPQVDEQKCVNCGLCEKSCPIMNKTIDGDIVPSVFAVINKDENVRLESSSGGIFTLLAERIINNGGVVFGAAFAKDFKSVEHIVVDKIEDLYKLRGSKYLQSKIGDAYKLVKQYLKDGKCVYFSGTPCQISGLYSYLGKNYDNLITQDLICHGVPSPLVWEKYVNYCEKKAASKTRRTFFRHKKYGWKKFSLQFVFEDGGKYSQTIYDDLYMRGFLTDLYLRPSCYNCSFKSIERLADITLADFWGVEKISAHMDDDKGTSLVFLHSIKGKTLFDKISDKIIFDSTDLDFAVRANSAMIKSAKPHRNRDKFFKNLQTFEIDRLIDLCLKTPFYLKCLRRGKAIIKRMIKLVTNG